MENAAQLRFTLEYAKEVLRGIIEVQGHFYSLEEKFREVIGRAEFGLRDIESLEARITDTREVLNG